MRRSSKFVWLFSVASALSATSVACELLNPTPKGPEPATSAPSAAPSSNEPPGFVAPTGVELPAAGSAEPADAGPSEPVAPGVVQEGGPRRGTLPKRVVRQVVDEAHASFEACYQRAKRPGLSGTIRVNFVVAADGSVPYAAELEQGSDFPDGEVVDCVLHAFQKLTFPAPPAGRAVVTYPIRFDPLPDAGAP